MPGPLATIPAAAALALAKSAAKHAGVPITQLTKRMIQNAPIPVRWKKLFQPKNTAGETKIEPAIKSSRAMAKGEAKFGLAGLGIGVTAGVAGAVLAMTKDKEKNKAQPNVRSGVKTGNKKKPKVTKPMGLASAAKAKQIKTSSKKAVKKALSSQPKKKVVKPKPRPKKPIPKIKPKQRP